MKVVLDANLSPDWVLILENFVSEVIHWSSIGQTTDPDTTIAEFARTQGFVILTQDLDFGTILSFGTYKTPSVICIRAGRVNPATLGLQVIAAINRFQTELKQGAFVTIEPKRTRMTLLPIGNRS